MSERFWSHIERIPFDTCWYWIGGTQRGYGAFQIGTFRAPHIVRAHRFAYEDQVGPIPDGLWVLHHCDNRLCVRPDHLFIGTRTDNMRDCASKGRLRIQKLKAARSD